MSFAERYHDIFSARVVVDVDRNEPSFVLNKFEPLPTQNWPRTEVGVLFNELRSDSRISLFQALR